MRGMCDTLLLDENQQVSLSGCGSPVICTKGLLRAIVKPEFNNTCVEIVWLSSVSIVIEVCEGISFVLLE